MDTNESSTAKFLLCFMNCFAKKHNMNSVLTGSTVPKKLFFLQKIKKNPLNLCLYLCITVCSVSVHDFH